MNPIARELNDTIKGTLLDRVLSDFGRRIFFPRGIVAQTTEATERAHRFNATVGMASREGRPIMLPSLSRVIPDLSPDEAVSYAPTAGVPELRRIWRDEIRKKNPTIGDASFSLPAVVPGLTSGLSLVADLFFDPGNTLVLPDMYWGNYRLIADERHGASLATFPFFSPAGELDLDAFADTIRAVTGSKVLVLLNFPNNPTGYSPSFSEAERIVSILTAEAERRDIVVVLDDAYYGLFYERETYTESLFAPLCRAHKNLLAIKVDGTTKEEFTWGFRIGFVTFGGASIDTTGHDVLVKKLMGAIRSSVSNSSRIAQSLLIRLLTSAEHEAEKRHEFETLKTRYRKIKEILASRADHPRLRALPFNSGYFMSFRCDGISAEAMRIALLDSGIGVISIDDVFIRIAFSGVDTERLLELFDEVYRHAEAL